MTEKELPEKILELQVKNLSKRREKEEKERERKQKEHEKQIGEIETFFEENRDSIVCETLKTLSKEMEGEDKKEYEIKWKRSTTLSFGCSRNEYNTIFEKMIKKELKKCVQAMKVRVIANIVSESDGHWTATEWVQTGFKSVMIVQVFFSY